jgi:hypothetical protein
MSEGTILPLKRKLQKPLKPSGSYSRGFVRGLAVGLGLTAVLLAVFVKPGAKGKISSPCLLSQLQGRA